MIEKINLIIPLVHTNGSGQKNLVRDYQDAASSVSEALSKVCTAYPHMRDYYPLDNSEALFKIAQEQHTARLVKLGEVINELTALALGVQRQ
jgi:glucokinase